MQQQDAQLEAPRLEATELATQSLMEKYVDVVNATLDKHGRSFPLRQILRAFDRLLDSKRIGVAVYSTMVGSPHDYFTLCYNEAQRLEVVGSGKHAPNLEWKVKRSYLERVVSDPERYVDNPVKLDWEWLKSRLSANQGA